MNELYTRCPACADIMTGCISSKTPCSGYELGGEFMITFFFLNLILSPRSCTTRDGDTPCSNTETLFGPAVVYLDEGYPFRPSGLSFGMACPRWKTTKRARQLTVCAWSWVIMMVIKSIIGKLDILSPYGKPGPYVPRGLSPAAFLVLCDS